MKHTQEKWEKYHNGTFWEVVTREELPQVSIIQLNPYFHYGEKPPNWGGSAKFTMDEGSANANLIASAPEMLELLEEIRGIAEKRDEVHPDNLDMLYRMLGDIGGLANRAIAKSEGE